VNIFVRQREFAAFRNSLDADFDFSLLHLFIPNALE